MLCFNVLDVQLAGSSDMRNKSDNFKYNNSK